ncbi:MAG: Gldg family protein [Planctomycetia bacterium]|nr:Gldg family protein [Planctomycetia bacterium]
MNTQVIKAIFFRNFYSYFSNPTGYVFICVFVLLSTFAAFWNNAFFVTNLANLDQLTPLFPFVMLVFIPAITMSVWADERRQGTDELILTLPAHDWDVVLGKYLASAAIYFSALVFSAMCNFAVLRWLGNPDVGLFLCTYAGYFFIGLAMLAIGMVASFLTANLTIAYLLGAILNAPLVFAVYADTIFHSPLAQMVQYWSIRDRFAPFGRGILSFASIFYFVAIAVVMLYACMILIGRRHWYDGTRGRKLAWHYLVRAVALLAIVSSLTLLCSQHDWQEDCTSERLNSLCPDTISLLKSLEAKHPVEISAYISPQVPEEYVQVKYNLEAMLHQIQTYSGGKVRVRIYHLERFTEAALQAEKDFGILPQRVNVVSRGNMETAYVYLGVAMTCGLNRDVTPFLTRGLSVEYELVRSLLSVTAAKRKRIGILATDAHLMGGFSSATMQITPPSPIVTELQRSCEVIPVSAREKIDISSLDALLAVQPSTLPPEEMKNFIQAVSDGLPTAIFEDPMPIYGDITSTSGVRRPPQNTRNPFLLQQENLPKGDIRPLWTLLGMQFSEKNIVSQQYTPIPRLAMLPSQFVIIDRNSLNPKPFSRLNPVTRGMRRLIIPFGGYLAPAEDSAKDAFVPLVVASANTGVARYDDLLRIPAMGSSLGNLNPDVAFEIDKKRYAMAAEIQKKNPRPDHPDIHAIVTADIDMLFDIFFQFRAEAVSEDVDFDNVTYTLNVLDRLCDETRFFAIREHQPVHRKLVAIDKITAQAQEENARERKKLQDAFQQMVKEEQDKIEQEKVRLASELERGKINKSVADTQLSLFVEDRLKRMMVEEERARTEMQQKIELLETELQAKIVQAQNRCKWLAVILPPILPLLVAIGVFLRRKWKQREGVSQRRLRKKLIIDN